MHHPVAGCASSAEMAEDSEKEARLRAFLEGNPPPPPPPSERDCGRRGTPRLSNCVDLLLSLDSRRGMQIE